MTRTDYVAMDVGDRLAPLRGQFALEAVDALGTIYLDRNSLGVLPRSSRAVSGASPASRCARP